MGSRDLAEDRCFFEAIGGELELLGFSDGHRVFTLPQLVRETVIEGGGLDLGGGRLTYVHNPLWVPITSIATTRGERLAYVTLASESRELTFRHLYVGHTLEVHDNMDGPNPVVDETLGTLRDWELQERVRAITQHFFNML